MCSSFSFSTATLRDHKDGRKGNRTYDKTSESKSVTAIGQDQPSSGLTGSDSKYDGVNDDITKASQEVAEISRLIGKPLTDSHALAMLKSILLEKIHTKLEETKDTASASSKSTEEGVSKFVAALAASQKNDGESGMHVTKLPDIYFCRSSSRA